MRLEIQSSTKFALQQLIQSVFTLSVLGTKKDVAILKQLIETQNDPILRALLAETK
jgi:hypothetical protein